MTTCPRHAEVAEPMVHSSCRALGWALATGATIAIYTVIDAQGVRAAPSAPSYIVWVFLSLGFGK